MLSGNSSEARFEPNARKSLAACIVTLGCAKNEVDSAHMRSRLIEAGYTLEDDPSVADAIIVNTCSFIQSATEESIDLILELADLDSVGHGNCHIVVAGCMPARYGKDLESELSEVRAFVPCSREDDIAQVLDQLFFDSASERNSACSREDVHAHQDGVFAYVKISDGCDRWCSYCTIPLIRGPYHSFSYEAIRKQVSAHVQAGKSEIVLIAQDTGRWGLDFGNPCSLAWLLEMLSEEFANVWFRVLYLEPEGVTDELLEVMASHENICNYLDIPLQHVDADILKSMNRHGSRQEFEALLDRILKRIPDITLRTTLIVGFPGESEEQFEDLCDFVESSPFTYIGAFAYSPEEGTRAYDMPDQVDEDEKADRLQQIRDIADAVCTARVAERVGKRMTVLVEGCEEDGQLYGRTQSQAPEVDGVTYLEWGVPGQFEDVLICDTLMYEMEGEI
ncbi:MAG: 30S ribosomal protein S12 methylthiotransferase RimO [Eggerthellaceae bacterium]|nr:30S ribosomal protein S12 methylthiotransferase RimO [Eggerthellaceae bacterium]